ncbi:hypothetical protein E2562_013955 [Oryza meyeriana var. granulata]|uniref:Uncharacterized protein n=1 Tax=Oryza meyeriana var. granulata TaxID=110450 RepID=A0A6G1DJ83_9ORYZ|nr:hypothetical protein E2562_013955 [Oryza meyeriana var. granulata]
MLDQKYLAATRFQPIIVPALEIWVFDGGGKVVMDGWGKTYRRKRGSHMAISVKVVGHKRAVDEEAAMAVAMDEP